MAPWNKTNHEHILSAALSHTLATRSEGSVKSKTAVGIVFVLGCFAVITCVFLGRPNQDTLHNLISSLPERLRRMVPRLGRMEPTPVAEENELEPMSRPSSTFPPLASRSSTFDQHLPPYSRQDPIAQHSSESISMAGEDEGAER